MRTTPPDRHPDFPFLADAHAPVRWVWILLLIFLLAAWPDRSGTALAQSLPLPGAAPQLVETGVPSFVVLGPEALGMTTAPADLKQLPDGRLLAIGHHELALGDGVRWQVFRQADGDVQIETQSVAVDATGNIYAGTTEGFARIEFGADARWRYKIVGALPPEIVGTPALAHTATVAGEWLWWWGSGPIVAWRPGQTARIIGRKINAPEHVFLLHGRLHLSDGANGDLYSWENGFLKLVSRQDSIFADKTVTSLVTLEDGRALVGTIAHGVFLTDGEKLLPVTHSGLLSGSHRITDLCATEGGYFAAAVDNVGIVFFDRTGRIIQVLNRSVDHRLARVKRLLPTTGGVIWARLNDGVARISFPDRFSHMEPLVPSGLAFAQPYRNRGKLWVMADGRAQRGIYDADQRLERFEVDTPPGHVSSMVELNGDLLAGGAQGIFLREGDAWSLVAAGPVSAYINPRPIAYGVWLYTAEDEIGWLLRIGGKYSIERFLEPGLGHVYGTLADDQGNYWIELGTGRIARIQTALPRPLVTVFDRTEGVPDGWVQIFKVDGRIRLNAADQILRFDETSGRFVPDLALLQRLPHLSGAVGRPNYDARHRLWVTSRGRVQVLPPGAGPDSQSEEDVPDGLLTQHFTQQADGVVWLHQRMRLTRYDPAMPAVLALPQRVLITRLQFPHTNRELFTVGNEIPPLEAHDNAFIVHFLAPNNAITRPVTFEVKLEGATGGWVSTGVTGTAAFNHLDEGNYVLRIRPRAGGVTGIEARLAFTVLSPWYRTNYAYLGYTLGVITLVLTVVWLSTLLERRENTRLEHLVAQRTGELHDSNSRLAQQVDEIQMLSQAITQSPVSVIIAQPDGTIVFANPRSAELTGYPAVELFGQNLRILHAAENPPALLAELTATVEQGASWHGQMAKSRKDGAIIQVRATVAPLRGPDGQIRLQLVLEEDITAWLAEQVRRQKLEQRLTQSQKLESLGTLAGGIAHDFNNILTGILGYCELSQLTAPDEPGLQGHLQQITAAGMRAKDLVRQILTFSRRNLTQLAPLDLARQVEEALKLIRASTPATIDIRSQLESGTISADATQIQQVVLNLCTNAAHAMRDTSGRLTVSVQRVLVDAPLSAELVALPAGPAMRLTVSDTGTGMDATTLARIFDPFFTTKPQGEGTGLGLSIVQGVVAGHSGGLRVQSEPGNGTSFELYFPITQEALPAKITAQQTPRGANQELLLVDDEPAVVEFAATRLRQLGYRVESFTDPRRALLAHQSAPTRFHAIVTDLTMPHLTGIQLIQETRKLTPGLPALIITGYGHAAGGAQFEVQTHSRMLYKPFSGDDLARALHEILAARSGA